LSPKANSTRLDASQGAARSTGRFPRTALALLCLGLSITFSLSGCQNAPTTAVVSANVGPKTPTADPVISPGTTPTNPSSASVPVAHEAFDADNAYAILKKQCDFGVRPLGTDAHEKTKDYLIAEMKKVADTTLTQTFQYHGMPVTNVIGIFNPAGSNKPAARPILLMAHWDTRPIADGPYSDKRSLGYRYGPEGWKPTAPIMGANDAASGVAVLLEMARIFQKQKPNVGVILLLDDGEDYGDFLAEGGKGNGVELGSRYFATHFSETPAFGKPFYGILLDMVGGKGATFPREAYSDRFAQSINDNVFMIASQLGYKNVFLSQETQDVNDDHVAINEAGIRMIDLIHPLPSGSNDARAYRYWHTQQDTADKCSPKTLKIVGDVVLEVIYRELP
jgi:glutaminyl-peptide cyclotransferase